MEISAPPALPASSDQEEALSSGGELVAGFETYFSVWTQKMDDVEVMLLRREVQGREKRLVNLVKQDPGKARQNS